MGKFLDTHPTLYNAAEIDANGTKYTRLNSNGTRTLEQWTKNDDGEWIDTTEQARLTEQIEQQKKAIKAERIRAARREFLEKQNKIGTNV